MLWEVEIVAREGFVDREGARIAHEALGLDCQSIGQVGSGRVFLIEGALDEQAISQLSKLLVDPVTEDSRLRCLESGNTTDGDKGREINVLYKPGMTDNVALSTKHELEAQEFPVDEVATCRRYWFSDQATEGDLDRIAKKVLANSAIENVIHGSLSMDTIAVGSDVPFELSHIPILNATDDELMAISRDNLLSLSLIEMKTIQKYFADQGNEPTDIELETVAQTWSEHCSHKTLAGRIRYTDPEGTRQFENMLKETIFKATQEVRKRLGDKDWCVSVFKDNAGIVTFNDKFDACIKVETHNRPSALEPYGGANTGIGGVIRDCLGTGLGGRPVANTDVFCFAPPEVSHDSLPAGVLHPKTIARGVVAGVRDYGNRMGIPTVNGAIFFDERYLGNPLVYCGNIAVIPRGKSEKHSSPGEYIVAIGGRTGLDGIHGATFSSAVMTEDSEETSGGAVQIGNAITEKMVADAVLEARDRNLFTAVTDCGAGGFSSAIGEMAEETGAEVWLDRAPLKYSGLTYTQIWISEAQERMVLSVPPENWEEFKEVCESEGVEATILGKFTDTNRLVLKFNDQVVGDLTMEFMHDGRPPLIREATFTPPAPEPLQIPENVDCGKTLCELLASPNICSKEWVIRQYDHEVLGGSVVKPLMGVTHDGPSDAAVIQPDLESPRGLVISNGMNPHYGDFDPYWMAVSAVDEAIRNCVATGANPNKIAVLDNFCWGKTDRPETLGALVRSALGCEDAALAYGTPFISGKDSLHNEFEYQDGNERKVVSIPHSLLISALGQIDDVSKSVTTDLKSAGNKIGLIGITKKEFGGSHFHLVNGTTGGVAPQVDFAAAMANYVALNKAMQQRWIRSCHDLSEGGLAVAIAEMAFCGGLGAEISIEQMLENSAASASDLDAIGCLFSETNSRLLIEVKPEHVAQVEALFGENSLAWLGEVVAAPELTIKADTSKTLVQEPISKLKSVWQNTIQWD